MTNKHLDCNIGYILHNSDTQSETRNVKSKLSWEVFISEAMREEMMKNNILLMVVIWIRIMKIST